MNHDMAILTIMLIRYYLNDQSINLHLSLDIRTQLIQINSLSPAELTFELLKQKIRNQMTYFIIQIVK